MRTAAEQLPGFIFYLGAGGVLLLIIAVIEAVGERASAKRRKAAIRRARRARAWAEVGRL